MENARYLFENPSVYSQHTRGDIALFHQRHRKVRGYQYTTMYCNPRKGHHNTSHSTTRIDSYQKRISPLYSIINDLCYSFNILLPPSPLTIYKTISSFSSPYLQPCSSSYYKHTRRKLYSQVPKYQYTTVYWNSWKKH